MDHYQEDAIDNALVEVKDKLLNLVNSGEIESLERVVVVLEAMAPLCKGVEIASRIVDICNQIIDDNCYHPAMLRSWQTVRTAANKLSAQYYRDKYVLAYRG